MGAASLFPGTEASRNPDKLAVIMAESGESISYGQLHDHACRIAQLFRAAGLCVGDTVALCLRNSLAFPIVHWAATYAGLNAVLLSYHLRRHEMAYILSDSAARVLVIDSEILEGLGQTLHEQFPDLERYGVGKQRDGLPDLFDAAASFPAQILNDAVQGQDLLYSSGTTGMPKGIEPPEVGLPLGTGSALVAFQQDAYGADANTVYLTPAPYYHTAPSASVKAMLSIGATAVLMERFDAEGALRAIERYRVTHSQWVPTMFVRMLALPEPVKQSFDLSSLQVAVHAAAPCPVAVKRQMFAWWGPIIHEYYGGSEGVGLTYCAPAEWLERPGTVGTARWGQVHILDEDDRELEAGEVGAVYFSGHQQITYRGDPVASAATRSRQGWSTIGEVGFLDEDGYLFLTDRASDMVISGGVNIYPREIENVLLEHGAVVEAAAFGVPDDDLGEVVRAVVVLRPGHDAGSAVESELLAFLRERLAAPKRPRSIEFRTELPSLPTGKVLKRHLREEYAGAGTV